MSNDPDKNHGDRYTWKKGDLVFLKQGHGEPMNQEAMDAILARSRPTNAGRPSQPPAEGKPDAHIHEHRRGAPGPED